MKHNGVEEKVKKIPVGLGAQTNSSQIWLFLDCRDNYRCIFKFVKIRRLAVTHRGLRMAAMRDRERGFGSPQANHFRGRIDEIACC